jgi:hypothetical protein
MHEMAVPSAVFYFSFELMCLNGLSLDLYFETVVAVPRAAFL